MDLRKMLLVLTGSLFIALGIVMFINASNGADPISIFLQGVNNKTGIKIGNVNQILNIGILCAIFFLDKSLIGVGSFIGALSLGIFIDTIFIFYKLQSVTIFGSYVETTCGVILIGFGTAVFIFADYGKGAIECLMIYISVKSGISLKFTRMTMDFTFVLIGYRLGGVVGFGTVLGVVGIGIVIEYSLKGLSQFKNGGINNVSS